MAIAETSGGFTTAQGSPTPTGIHLTENRIEPHEVIVTPPLEEPRLSQASEGSEAPSETPSEASSPPGKTRRYRGDTSKRRKGVYITQWPEPLDADRNKLTAQSSEERDEPPATPSDLSDCEGHAPRRYSKRPLRGPYGQMLEAEMAKPRATDISLEEGLRPRRKVSANLSYNTGANSSSEPPTPCHHRTTSSPSKLEGLPGPSPELLAELLRGSSERVARAPAHRNVKSEVRTFYVTHRLVRSFRGRLHRASKGQNSSDGLATSGSVCACVSVDFMNEASS
uniref:Uncharacterized protein n=1 Tax=Vespula pensylvanica TaxID=30213 RepID=A0A834P4L7_VESPE|nr:hypothetical protein H0235_007298 [Vespula pensylvanica]